MTTLVSQSEQVRAFDSVTLGRENKIMNDVIQENGRVGANIDSHNLWEEASRSAFQLKPDDVSAQPQVERAAYTPSDKTVQYVLAAAKSGDKAAAPPEEHTMSSRILSWGWTFDITDKNGKSEGMVDQRVLNLRKTFDYKDENGNTKARGQERLFSWGTKIDVYDENGKAIGGIQEQIFKSWWHPYTVYSIVDAQGKEVAKSEKLELLATNFTLTNEKGEKIATIHRPWLNFLRENWTVDIEKPDEVDKRILYMIPAYKTAADAERKAEEEEEQRKKDEEEEKSRSNDDDN